MKVTVKAGTFVLDNEGKVRRVINDTKAADGSIITGLGSKAEHGDVIAAYDKIAGLILGKEGAHVKTGCFYDYEAREPSADPKVIYTFRVVGKTVEVAAGDPVPLEVQATESVKPTPKKAPRKSKK